MFVFKSLQKFAVLGVVGIMFLSARAILCATEVTTGSTVVLTVSVNGSRPFSYQWQKGGANLAGATGDNYRIASAQAADAGTYAVTVSNSLGSTKSNAVTLTVQAGVVTNSPSVSIRNQNQIVTTGHAVSFTAENGVAGGEWQVSSNGSTWSSLAASSTYRNVTTGTLEITGVNSGMNGNRYRYLTSGGASNAATLTVAPAYFPFPTGIAVDGGGNLFVSDTAADIVQKISPSGSVSQLAGAAGQTGTIDGSGSAARFNDPAGIATAADGALGIADSANGTIRQVSSGGTVSTLAGSTSNRGNVDGIAASATFSSPLGIARDGNGNFYVTDPLNNTVRKVTASGTVSTLAGSANAAGSADGTGSGARFNHPTGIAVDGAGNVYVSDSTNNTIRKITPAGVVSTLAGLAGVSGFQDGSGGAALFNNPGGLAVNGSGVVHVADTGNSTIRQISPAGAVTTLAGLPGIAGLMDGEDSSAWFNQPEGLALDASGNLFVADTGNAAVRKVTAAGNVTTVALSGALNAPGNTGSSSSPETNPSTPTPGNTPPATSGSSGSASGGSSGGGGTMEGWLAASLGLVCVLRRFLRRR